jgi:hypothetical protein
VPIGLFRMARDTGGDAMVVTADDGLAQLKS